MIGFSVSGGDLDLLTITCSKCACSYTADQMENETDDELNEQHRVQDPQCKVLLKIFNDYQGRLRLPGARRQPVVRQLFQPPFYLQPGPIYSYSYPLPAATITTTTTTTTTKQAQFQDDIISDSLPGIRFSGSGPTSSRPTSNDNSMSTVPSTSTTTTTTTSTSAAAYGEYKYRFESFGSNWKNRAKKNARPSPEVLAEAGMFEYPQERKDAAKCYACDVVLYGWKGNDEDVWAKHAQMSPYCPHVLKEKGKDFIEAAAVAQNARRPATKQNLLDLGVDAKWIKTVTEMRFSLDDFLLVALYKQHLEPENTAAIFTNIQEPINWILYKKNDAEKNFQKFASKWPKDDSDSSQGRDSSSNTTDDGEIESSDGPPAPFKYEETQCKICFSSGANMLLQPCNHLISCENCTKRLKNCPVCRKPIMGVTKLYFERE